MESPPQLKRVKSPVIPVILFTLALAALGGIVYTMAADKPPSWLSFLIPGSQYKDTSQPDEQRLAAETAPHPEDVPASPGGSGVQEPAAPSAAVRQSIVPEDRSLQAPEKIYKIPPPYDSPPYDSGDSPMAQAEPSPGMPDGLPAPSPFAEAPPAPSQADTSVLPPPLSEAPAQKAPAQAAPITEPSAPIMEAQKPQAPLPSPQPKPQTPPPVISEQRPPLMPLPKTTPPPVMAAPQKTHEYEGPEVAEGDRPDKLYFNRGEPEMDLPQIPKPVRGNIKVASSSPTIMYGKASPLNTGGSAVRGNIPESQTPPAAISTYREEAEGQGETLAMPPREDTVVPVTFVDDLAAFLAENYWPAGTHPMATNKGVTTASLKLANLKYGSQLHGLNAPSEAATPQRQQVLEYVFLPSMLQGLYALYSPRFVQALDQQAHLQTRGDGKTALTDAQIAEMYGLYATQAKGLADAVRAYSQEPEARELVAAYDRASSGASEAYRQFTESKESDGGELVNASRYQEAVIRREQAKEELANTLQSNGSLKGLDADTLVYTAQWLYRRGKNQEQMFRALASVLDACASKMRAAQTKYTNTPPVDSVPDAPVPSASGETD